MTFTAATADAMTTPTAVAVILTVAAPLEDDNHEQKPDFKICLPNSCPASRA